MTSKHLASTAPSLPSLPAVRKALALEVLKRLVAHYEDATAYLASFRGRSASDSCEDLEVWTDLADTEQHGAAHNLLLAILAWGRGDMEFVPDAECIRAHPSGIRMGGRIYSAQPDPDLVDLPIGTVLKKEVMRLCVVDPADLTDFGGPVDSLDSPEGPDEPDEPEPAAPPPSPRVRPTGANEPAPLLGHIGDPRHPLPPPLARSTMTIVIPGDQTVVTIETVIVGDPDEDFPTAEEWEVPELRTAGWVRRDLGNMVGFVRFVTN